MFINECGCRNDPTIIHGFDRRIHEMIREWIVR